MKISKSSFAVVLALVFLLVAGAFFFGKMSRPEEMMMTQKKQQHSLPPVQNNQEKTTIEVVITTTDRAAITISGSLLRVADVTGKVWNVDYKEASFVESWIAADGEHTRAGDLSSWIKGIHLQGSPDNTGSGAPGAVKIKGTLDAQGIFHATSISQHVQ